MRKRVLASVKANEALLAQLEAKLALAQRFHFLVPEASAIDEAAYLQWLETEGYAKDRTAAERLLADTSVASKHGRLDGAALTKWVQSQIHVGIAKEAVELKAFAAETLCPIDPQASALTDRALGQLLEVARTKSLFKHAELALPSVLDSPGIGVLPVPASTLQSVRATLKGLRQVGSREARRC